MPFTVTFTATAFVSGSLRSSGNTLLVDDPTARMLVDLGVATAPGLTAQTGAVAPNLARTDGATFTGKLNTLASSTTTAGLNVPNATAPSTPVDGDVWTTTVALQARIAGSTRTFAQSSNTNVFSAGFKQTFSHSATTAGLNVGPVAGDPSGLANGDLWYNSTTGYLNARANGMNGQLNAVRAWVVLTITTGTPAVTTSYNVTSVTDNGVGDFSINFTNAIADTNYAYFLDAIDASAANTYYGYETWASAIATTSLRVRFAGNANNGTNVLDPNRYRVAVLR